MMPSRMLPALLLLAACSGAASPAAETEVFPRAHEVFHRLLADPRQVQLSASYYRLGGADMADAALGHSWGLWRLLADARRAGQLDVEGMATSRFRLAKGINDFQTVDFVAAVPASARCGAFSGKLTLFHESSHLGDDYIRRTGDLGFRYSREGLRGLLSWEPAFAPARLYGGGSYLLHEVPAAGRAGVQVGLEIQGVLRRLCARLLRFYLAEDLQYRAQADWRPSSRTAAGVRIAFKDSPRALRVRVGYFTGRSPFGQFYLRHESRWDAGFDFEL